MKYKNEKKDPLTRTLTREKDKISKNVPLDLGIVLENTSQEWVSNLPSDASRLEQLKRLRARALICVLTNSGLRVGDIVLLTKSWRYHDIDSSGSVEIVTAMSGIKTFCHFSESTLRYLDEYLEARDDISPWLFIQHGKYGTNTATNPSYYSRENSNSKGLRKRYGAPISTLTVSNIVRSIVDLAGYSKDDNITPQSIRHWLAKYLINNNVPLEKIQNALGHSSLDSLKEMYTPPSSQEQAIKCIENRNSKSKNGL